MTDTVMGQDRKSTRDITLQLNIISHVT